MVFPWKFTPKPIQILQSRACVRAYTPPPADHRPYDHPPHALRLVPTLQKTRPPTEAGRPVFSSWGIPKEFSSRRFLLLSKTGLNVEGRQNRRLPHAAVPTPQHRGQWGPGNVGNHRDSGFCRTRGWNPARKIAGKSFETSHDGCILMQSLHCTRHLRKRREIR